MAIRGDLSLNQVGRGNSEGDASREGTCLVHADPTCFRDLVQRLTGPPHVTHPQPTRKQVQKLHERRRYSKPNLEISKPDGFEFQTSMQPNISLSSGAIFGASACSYPASPMMSPSSGCGGAMPGTLKRVSSTPIELNPKEEEKAIKEKRFYLHPSPRSKQRVSPKPELLTLFPLESPTGADATSNRLI